MCKLSENDGFVLCAEGERLSKLTKAYDTELRDAGKNPDYEPSGARMALKLHLGCSPRMA